MKNKKFIVIFYSAVAFFFLFFLHGTSIGTRQQGISYNVLRIREADNCVGFVGRDWRFTLYAVMPSCFSLI